MKKFSALLICFLFVCITHVFGAGGRPTVRDVGIHVNIEKQNVDSVQSINHYVNVGAITQSVIHVTTFTEIVQMSGMKKENSYIKDRIYKPDTGEPTSNMNLYNILNSEKANQNGTQYDITNGATRYTKFYLLKPRPNLLCHILVTDEPIQLTNRIILCNGLPLLC